jgi:hypothetical protein
MNLLRWYPSHEKLKQVEILLKQQSACKNMESGNKLKFTLQ